MYHSNTSVQLRRVTGYVHMYLFWALPMSTNNFDNPIDLGKYPHELAIVNLVDRHSEF